MAMNIFQIQVVLLGFKPKIWRRILIPSDLLLSDFHKIIQTTMGWTNSHLHHFIKNGIYYSVKFPDDDFWDNKINVDYKKKKVCISDILNIEKAKITYEYDFGDGWIHDIILEKILLFDENVKYPTCLAGKMSCPPEDCGGVWGYSDMLEILKQPDTEEYDSYIEWLGGEFDPEYFNKEEVNELLHEKNFGCFEF
jgi:Plasmid pRiA4b ORF-3-like protein